jgi:uncharacterized protein YodC (DUF2158 family)
MPERHFVVGDIVKLKSGGPPMTVKEVFEPDADDILRRKNTYEYRCQWFAGSKLQDGIFTEEGLEVPADDSENSKRK